MTLPDWPRSRLRPPDALRLGLMGARARPTRAVLSALGIAIGITAIVGVTGISSSSRAGLLAQLDQLGTNLLTVAAGQSLTRGPVQLSTDAPGMVRRVPPVQVAAATGSILGAGVRRSPYIPAFETGGIGVRAAEPGLLAAVGARLVSGVFLSGASADYPVAVLGATAAVHLGITSAPTGQQVWIAGRPFLVVGVLAPVPLAPEIDRSALVGWGAAARLLGFDGHPTTIYLRADPSRVQPVQAILARTVDPEHPEEVLVSRPSDALAARAAADDTLTYLLVGLGLVALLVGAIGIANVMLIGVLERRPEIGLRRALGATRTHVAVQFLVEALALGAFGGAVGCAAGVALTSVFALANHWLVDLPPAVLVAAMGASLLVGSVAGVVPAIRAARLPPMQALRSV